jgi:hypothetical protein
MDNHNNVISLEVSEGKTTVSRTRSSTHREMEIVDKDVKTSSACLPHIVLTVEY